MRRSSLLVASLLGLLWAACGDEPTRKPRPASSSGKTEVATAGAPSQQAEPAAEEQPEETWSYSPAGKRDPFRSYFDMYEPAESAPPTVVENCGPVCQWELEQLRVTAIVSGTASPLAMLEDPEGRGHLVRRGSYVGKRQGRVSAIQRDRIVVTELIRNRQGQVIPTQTELFLRSERDRGPSQSSDMVDLSLAGSDE